MHVSGLARLGKATSMAFYGVPQQQPVMMGAQPMGYGGGGMMMGGGGGGGMGGAGRGRGDCNPWKATGRCSFAANCRFAHDPDKKGSDGGTGGGNAPNAGGGSNTWEVVVSKSKESKSKKGGDVTNKVVDFDGEGVKKGKVQVGLITSKSDAKKGLKLDYDGDLLNEFIPVPRHLKKPIKKLCSLAGVKAKDGSGRKLGEKKGARILDQAVTQIEGAGFKGASDSDNTDGSGDSDEDKIAKGFQGTMNVLEQGFQKMLSMNAAALAAASAPGVTISPSGKRRKNPKGRVAAAAAASSSSVRAGAGAAAAKSAAKLYDTEDEDEEDSEETEAETDPRVEHFKKLKDLMNKAYDGNDIKWDNKNVERAFERPGKGHLVGLETMCGNNNDPSATVKVKAEHLDAYLMLFDEADFTNAVHEVGPLVTFWKSWKEPAKRADLMLRTHKIELEGKVVNRKMGLPLLAMIIARQERVSDIPNPNDISL